MRLNREKRSSNVQDARKKATQNRAKHPWDRAGHVDVDRLRTAYQEVEKRHSKKETAKRIDKETSEDPKRAASNILKYATRGESAEQAVARTGKRNREDSYDNKQVNRSKKGSRG